MVQISPKRPIMSFSQQAHAGYSMGGRYYEYGDYDWLVS